MIKHVMGKAIIGMTLCVGATQALAAPKSNDLPNGKPFQNIQGQINEINLSIEELTATYDARLDAIDASIVAIESRLDVNEHDIDAISAGMTAHNARISTLEAEIDVLELRMADVELLSVLHAERLNAIDARVVFIQSNIASIEQDVGQMWQAVNTLQYDGDQLEAALAANTRTDNLRHSELRNVIYALKYSLLEYCAAGEVVTGVTYEYNPAGEWYPVISCSSVSQNEITVYYRSNSAYQSSFCDVEIIWCLDTDYYQRASVYCPSGYVATGGGYYVSGGTVKYNYPSGSTGWQMGTYSTDSSKSLGRVYAKCIRR